MERFLAVWWFEEADLIEPAAELVILAEDIAVEDDLLSARVSNTERTFNLTRFTRPASRAIQEVF